MISKLMKKLIFISFIIVISTSSIIEVNAFSLPKSNTCYYFHRTNGTYSTSKKNSNYAKDCVKKYDGETYYCIELKKAISHNSYKQNTNWKETSKNAIVTGIIIENVNDKYDGAKAYAIATQTLNTYFYKNLKYSKSRNYYGTNDTIKKLYDEAVEEYTKIYKSKTLPMKDIKKAGNDGILNYDSKNKFFISDKITISNLMKTYGRSTDEVTYKISSANENIKFCSRADGLASSCKDSISVTGVTSKSFYVKIAESKISQGATLSIKITGSNSSKYPSTKQYISTKSVSTTQKLIKIHEITIKRSNTTSLILHVPNLTNYTIKAVKVDELGNELNGATLAIFEGNPATDNNAKELASGLNSTVSYTSGKLSSEDNDFLNKDYYLVEKASPEGYVTLGEPKQIFKAGTLKTNSTICYYTGIDGEEAQVENDMERCNFSDYVYKCKAKDADDIKDLDEQADCQSYNVTIPEEPEGGEDPEGGIPEGEEQNPPAEDGLVEQAVTITYEKVCYNNKTNQLAAKAEYCDPNEIVKYTKIETKNKENITITQPNKKNSVTISKKAITGDEEIAGAQLKICTEATYNVNHNDCEAAKTIADAEGNQVTMEWTSTNETKTFSGLPSGKYYIIEILPPNGYIKATTATEFEVKASGEILTNGKAISDSDAIVIKNQMNSLSISKQDIATSKELPGATLSICLTYIDENDKIQLETDQETGDCVPAILADGTEAIWKSTDKSHTVKGLQSGTYYLVENIAPTNYSTAEAILFTINDAGKILDANNKEIKDNKIVMKDEKIKEVKTGDLPIIAIVVICLSCLITGGACYKYANKKYNLV